MMLSFAPLAALSLRIPSACAVCHRWPSQAVCADCIERFAQVVPRCNGCARRVPLGQALCGQCVLAPIALDGCVAAVDYGYPWSDVITAFKYRNRPGWAPVLAGLLRKLERATSLLDQADAVIAVPLSRQRLATRGYNQSLLLAQSLAPKKVAPDLLLRIQDTLAQQTQDRAARLRNVEGAFAVDPLRTAQIAGRSFLLIDDVMTTGATLHSAAMALRQAGASRVHALVVARTMG